MTKQKPKRTKEVIRATFRLHGSELEQIREVRDLFRFNTELDALRYLVQRGIEAVTPSLVNQRTLSKVVASMNVDTLLKAIVEFDGKLDVEKLKKVKEE